jgi:DNA-binding MarR family transcriptional regulator
MTGPVAICQPTMAVNTAPPGLGSGSAAPRGGSPRLYLREDELDAGLAMIFDAAATLKSACEPARVRHGLSWADARALSSARTPQTVLALAARLSVAKQTLTKTLDGLERRGLIARLVDPDDRRRRMVSLTETGSAIENEIAAAMRARLANAYRTTGGEQVAGCDAVLLAVAGGRKAAGGPS